MVNPVIWPKKPPKAGIESSKTRYCAKCRTRRTTGEFPTRSLKRQDGTLVQICLVCIKRKVQPRSGSQLQSVAPVFKRKCTGCEKVKPVWFTFWVDVDRDEDVGGEKAWCFSCGIAEVNKFVAVPAMRKKTKKKRKKVKR